LSRSARGFETPTCLARGQRLHLRGVDYFIRQTGQTRGPLLLLLHGLLDTGESYAPLCHWLDDGWRIAAPDWRGHGDTGHAPAGYWFPDYVADLDALCDQLSPEAPVAIIAHSMGTNIAALYAGLRPTRVQALVCLDGLNVPHRRAEDVPSRYARWLKGQRRPRPERHYRSVAALARRVALRYPELDAERVRFLAHIWSRPVAQGVRLANDPDHLLPSPYGFDADAAMAVWRQTQARVFCLDGERSPARDWLSADLQQARRDVFPDSRHESLPGTGHFLHLEQPDTVAERINPFLSAARS
jgi:pimeloyl-ACP methyl ester carboxylesterase